MDPVNESLNALELVALALASVGCTDSDAGDVVPQRVWEALHDRGFLAAGDDHTDTTPAGDAALFAGLEDLALDRHEILVDEAGFGMKHPIECRPNLLACSLHKKVWEYGPPVAPGRYVLADEHGILTFTLLEQAS